MGSCSGSVYSWMSRSRWTVRPGSERKAHWAPPEARNTEGEEGPLGSNRGTELLQRVMVVGGDGDDLGVRHRHLGLERGQLEVLLVLLGAVVAPGQREDQRILALELAERPNGLGVVGERVVGEGAARSD